jgi:hypothetical protein
LTPSFPNRRLSMFFLRPMAQKKSLDKADAVIQGAPSSWFGIVIKIVTTHCKTAQVLK